MYLFSMTLSDVKTNEHSSVVTLEHLFVHNKQIRFVHIAEKVNLEKAILKKVHILDS